MNNGVPNNQDVPIIVPVNQTDVPASGEVATNTFTTPIVPSGDVVSPPIENPTSTPDTLPMASIPVEEDSKKKKKEKKKKTEKDVSSLEEGVSKTKKSMLPLFFFILLVAFGALVYYTITSTNRLNAEWSYRCTPATESREEVTLDVNSTLVQSLYSKVSTSVLEDFAQPEWNDTMRLYLAFRQIPDYMMYDSNCNMFSAGNMEPYTCEVSTNFIPKAFRTKTLQLEWKKLFGEETQMPLQNIKLLNSCIGGFEYIPERDEFVQGYCKQSASTKIRVKKELKSATSSRNTITLVEEVTYSGYEDMQVPDYLKSGTYYYTFRLDMNYNFVFLNKKYDEKYE